MVVATAPDYTTANGTPNTTAKFTAIATLANAWPTDDGTTWGVTSRFTIVEASGNFRSFGTATIDGASSMGGALNMNAHLINAVADPVSSQDAVTLAYANAHYGAGSVTSSTLTANTIPKATGAAAIGNSSITDDATTVTFGEPLAMGTHAISGVTDFTNTGNTTIGDAAADTLTINATATFANPITTKAVSSTSIAPAAITGTNNNWAPTGIDTAEVIYVATTNNVTLTGLQASSCTDGRTITLINVSTHTVKFTHGSGSSTRPFHNTGGQDWVLYTSTDQGPTNEVSSVTFRCSTTSSSWEMIGASAVHIPVLKVEGQVNFVGAVAMLTTQPFGLQANSHIISTNATTSVACNGTGGVTCLSTCTDLAGSITTNSAATTCTVTFGQSYGTNLQSCVVSTATAVATPAYISARSGTAITITFPSMSAGIVDYMCTGH